MIFEANFSMNEWRVAYTWLKRFFFWSRRMIPFNQTKAKTKLNNRLWSLENFFLGLNKWLRSREIENLRGEYWGFYLFFVFGKKTKNKKKCSKKSHKVFVFSYRVIIAAAGFFLFFFEFFDHHTRLTLLKSLKFCKKSSYLSYSRMN